MDGHTPADRTDDSGFSLIEVVVAMVLLALIAVAFLPVIAQATKSAARQTTVAGATHLLNRQLELARAPGVTCAQLSGAVGEDLRDGRNARYTVKVAMETGCPGLVTYSVTVATTRAPSKTLATASTYVLVQTS